MSPVGQFVNCFLNWYMLTVLKGRLDSSGFQFHLFCKMPQPFLVLGQKGLYQSCRPHKPIRHNTWNNTTTFVFWEKPGLVLDGFNHGNVAAMLISIYRPRSKCWPVYIILHYLSCLLSLWIVPEALSNFWGLEVDIVHTWCGFGETFKMPKCELRV